MKKIILILMILTCCQQIEDRNLGENYRLITSSSRYDLTIVKGKNEPYTVIVPGHIIDISYDSLYIVAIQKPRDSIPECRGEMNGQYNDCNEAFEKSTFQQYWIINKKEKSKFDEKTKTFSNVYGPFTKEKYLQKREELGVSKDLTLVIGDEIME